MSANNKQVGGTHYATDDDLPQHWDIVIAMGWDYLVGNATKYIWRLGKKHTSIGGQIEDINKAIHYLEKKREVLSKEFNKSHMVGYSNPLDDSDIVKANR